ncbi:MAG: GtrA family protein [Micrococcales bacterium]|nr:GtrA family protein [Micrococcales bacterium]
MKAASWANARQVLAYLAVGAASALVDFGVFFALHRLGLFDVAANVIAYACAFVVNYRGNRSMVFRAGKVPGALLRYCLLVAVNLVISTSLVRLGLALGWPDYLAKIASMAVVAAANFAALRWWVFRRRQPSG